MTDILIAEQVSKSFTLHVQGGAEIEVFRNLNLTLGQGECVALTGASGAGKSSLMRMIYANYRCQSGAIRILHQGDWLDLVQADPHRILDVRRETLGYVSQFLQVIPRTPTLEIVAEPLRHQGADTKEAHQRASELLTRLNIPENLWQLSPMTFSGGEQQRVNIARGFVARHPVLLLDEPTASLDARNRQTVLDLINEAKSDGTAILGIFHDQPARDEVCDREFDVTPYKVANDA